MNMKYLLILTFLITSSFLYKNEIIIDKNEAKKAFDLLVDIRNNPDKYYKELNYKKGLKPSSIQLKWNDTLAKIAETKAADMARRNYFGHVDPDGYGINYFINKSGYKLVPEWTKERNLNYFESIAVNSPGGEEAVKMLVIDKNTPSLGHRKHLLGLDNWNASLKDIGIGFCRRESGSKYKTYTCIIIAKHEW